MQKLYGVGRDPGQTFGFIVVRAILFLVSMGKTEKQYDKTIGNVSPSEIGRRSVSVKEIAFIGVVDG